MVKRTCSLLLCLVLTVVALIAIPISVSANGNGPETVEATVIIKPECLNLTSNGLFTAFITLPEGYDVANIDVTTVDCEGADAIKGMTANDKLVVKFERQDLEGVPVGDDVTFTVVGELSDGTPFVGSDTIRVIDKGAH